MNERDALNEDRMADIETQAIADTARRLSLSEKLVDEIIQEYTEMIDNFERYMNKEYPNGNMITQPYVAMEMTKKVTKDIADKHSMDEEKVQIIIQDYIEIIRVSLEREMTEELG
jgi:hypothetical protein